MVWIPLHVHSQYTILDSTVSISSLVEKAKKYGIKALALTDQPNLFGVVDFYKTCVSQEIKPIIGCELWIANNSRKEKKKTPSLPVGFPMVFLAKSQKGYQNLCTLSSLGFLEGFYYYPRIDKELLEKYHEDLICLSGSLNSPISFWAARGEKEKLEEEISWYKNIFKEDFYLEIQRHTMSEEDLKNQDFEKESWLLQKYQEFIKKQKKAEDLIRSIAQSRNIPLVATNDIHYLEKKDWKGHEILLNIQSGETCEVWERDSYGNPKNKVPNPKRGTYPSREYYFKSPEQMEKLFADIPEAIENTLKISEKCQCTLDFQIKHYPVFYPPGCSVTDKDSREKSVQEYLYNLCTQELSKRYTAVHLEHVKKIFPNRDPLEVVQTRLDEEFKIISSKGMCDYLLIVYDFISWAKKNNIPVGPGRGSAAGSIISYLTGITDIEPLRFSLFFERFINPERISYPDIDVDICMERRPEVIEYMINKYGKDKVAQIITFGKMKAKMAIKDVGRVLNVTLSKVNQITKLVPDDLNITIEKALQMDPDLRGMYEQDEEARKVLDIAMSVEGSIRNTSIHAAGLIVSELPIMQNVPVCTAKDTDIVVTQYAMKPVEAVGMLKIDFLGLKTLTSIQLAAELVEKNFQKKIHWADLPLDDKKTYDLLNQGKTLGIFQLESAGMQELAKHLHIDCFEEIIAVGALYRPGPMDMIPSFIQRKHGREEIESDHPLLEGILSETYGVMVYQEQVMQIANTLAGYSLGEGDVLRKAMGKKDHQEMNRQRKKFLIGAENKGITKEIAEKIFDKIEKFASYGFNKSHATAYAYLSYVTAYFKANFPKEWMAALMTCDIDDLSKVTKFIRECQILDIAILPPDINEASLEFMPRLKGIRFAMSAIKGIGSGIVRSIIQERKKGGIFKDLYDFIQRIDTSKVGKKSIELLVEAGSFDFTNWSRDQLKMSIESIYEHVSKEQKESSKGVVSLFSLIEDTQHSPEPPIILQKTPKEQIYQKEKELLGFFLTGHPLDSYKETLEKLECIILKDIESLEENQLFCAAFIIESVRVKTTNRAQRKFAILTISNEMERFELPIWPEQYLENQHILLENKLMFAFLQVDKSGENVRLQCKYIKDLATVEEVFISNAKNLFKEIQKKANEVNKKKNMPEPKEIKCLFIDIHLERLSLGKILEMKKIFRKFPGKNPIHIYFLSNMQKTAVLQIQSSWGIDPTISFHQEIQALDFVYEIKLQTIST